jgi:hypothetical protein
MIKSVQSYRFAGLRRTQAPGLSVGESADRLRRLAYAEERLMRLYATRIVTLGQRDIKVLLGRLQYEAAMHADGLRQRILELRIAKGVLNKPSSKALEIFFDEAEYLPGAYPYLAVLVRLIVPEIIRAYKAYLEAANDLADYPSVRLLRSNLLETEIHLELLQLAMSDLAASEDEFQEAQIWIDQLTAYLAANGGLDSTQTPGSPQKRRASQEPFHIPHEIRRDQSFKRVWDFEKPPMEHVQDHLNYMMGIRLSEINVAEGLAIVLCETPDMPWSFYADISRHLWDETRHSLFGEAAIEATYGQRSALPMRDYEGVFAMEASPLEQYAVLGLEIEGGNMRYPPGKRLEWEFCRDQAQHALMATFQDFDWADEVLHVKIARRELGDWFEGGLAHITPFAKSGRKHRTEVKQRKPATAISPSGELA